LSKNRAESIEDFDNFDPLFMKNVLGWGINTTSCGHVMHAACWQKYFDTIRMAENRRHVRLLSYDTKKSEYLCPLCETIGNSVLPLFPDLNELSLLSVPLKQEVKEEESSKELDEKMDVVDAGNDHAEDAVAASAKRAKRPSINLSYEDWLDGLEKTLENSIKKELLDDKDVFIINPCPLSSITKLMADAVASNFRSLFEFDYIGSTNILLSGATAPSSPQRSLTSPSATAVAAASSSLASPATTGEVKLHAETENIMEIFTRASYTVGFSAYPNDDDVRMPISIWTNCAYTIQVIGK
jgi:hypothetical protein